MIYFLLPIYNEDQNIEILANDLKQFVSTEDICFVFSDDGSTDQSVTMLRKAFKNAVIIGDGINRGPGYAFNVGFKWIIMNSKNDNDVVVTMEADGTSDLEILNDMLAINRIGYDLVLASVYSQGGGFDSTNYYKRFLSFQANLMFRFFFNIKIQTISSFYRVYSVPLLRKIALNQKELISEVGFICMLEMILKCINEDARIIEVPTMLYSKKRLDKSKMNTFNTTIQYFRFLLRHKLGW